MNADWVMVVMTAVYVIATILICVFNYRSAKATKEQVAEAKKQFEESNRAYVTISMELIKSGLVVLRIANQGNRIASNVRIHINDDFLDCLENKDRDNMVKLTQSTFSIGIGQKWYLLLDSHIYLDRLAQKNLELFVAYDDIQGHYEDHFSIAFGEYFWTIIYDSPTEDIFQEIKKQTKSLDKLTKEVDSIARSYKTQLSAQLSTEKVHDL